MPGNGLPAVTVQPEASGYPNADPQPAAFFDVEPARAGLRKGVLTLATKTRQAHGWARAIMFSLFLFVTAGLTVAATATAAGAAGSGAAAGTASRATAVVPQLSGLGVAGSAGFRLVPVDGGAPGGLEWVAGGLVQADWRAGSRGFGVAGGAGIASPPIAATAWDATGDANGGARGRGDVFAWASYGRPIFVIGNAGGAAGAALSWEGGVPKPAAEALFRATIANVAGELRAFARPDSYRAPLVVPEAAGYANGLFAALADPGVGGRYGTGSVLAVKYRASRRLSVSAELAGFGPSPAGAGIYAVPETGRVAVAAYLSNLIPGTLSAGASATFTKGLGPQPGVMVGYRTIVADMAAVSARLEWTAGAEAGKAWSGNLTAAIPLGETGVDLLSQFDLASRQAVIGFRGGF